MSALISVITVTRNAEQLLENTILSVLSQKNADFEYVIIDGASNDGTMTIINHYSDRIDKFISEKDSGIFDAMNKSRLHSSGKWLIFINAGDLFYDEFSLSRLALQISPEIDLIYGNHLLYGNNGFESQKRPGETNFKAILKSYDISHQAVLFNRVALNKLKWYNTDYKVCSDYDLILRILKNSNKNNIKYVDQFICKFYVDDINWKNGYKALYEKLKLRCNHSEEALIFTFKFTWEVFRYTGVRIMILFRIHWVYTYIKRMFLIYL